MTYFVGLGATHHDPALAIVNSEGDVVYAEATERCLQQKRAYLSPPDNLIEVDTLLKQFCPRDADLVVASSWSSRFHSFLKWLRWTRLGSRLAPKEQGIQFLDMMPWMAQVQLDTLNLQGQGLLLRARQRNLFAKVTLENYDHHLTHAANACYTSPFDEAVCAVIDGIGEFGAVRCYHFKNQALTPINAPSTFRARARLTSSLGIFYAVVCELCGFDVIKGEEWKVMGLSAYGKFDQGYYDLLRPLVRITGLTITALPVQEYAARLAGLKATLAGADSSDPRVANLAFTAQVVFTEHVNTLLGHLYERGLSDNLVLGGGCALNSACNGQVLQHTRFKRLHVPSAPADDGNALGAALLAFHKYCPGKPIPPSVRVPYLGSEMSGAALERLASLSRITKLRHLPGTMSKEAARILATGKIIGWVQGKAEFGPRALGNRSILADPRPADMKDRLNRLVKFREEFRPFAPSILAEYGADYFEHYQESPYMERALLFRKEVRSRVPAVVHVDGTGRLQTVRREWNERYFDLLREFKALTGIPLLLNTSFNIMGKPMIHTVEDAISVFFTTGLDALVIGDYLIEKPCL
jgi:carbamoyltransferase